MNGCEQGGALAGDCCNGWGGVGGKAGGCLPPDPRGYLGNCERGRSGVGEIVFVHRAEDIGFAGADADFVLDHQAGEAVAVDQDDAVLDLVQLVARFF